MKKANLKKRWIPRKAKLRENNLSLAHPVAKASYVWTILSDQLSDVLGSHLHHQFFSDVRPTVISQNVLILEVPNHFRAQVIHTHYQELIDLLLANIDKRLSCFFISQSERQVQEKRILAEGPATEVKRQREDENGQTNS